MHNIIYKIIQYMNFNSVTLYLIFTNLDIKDLFNCFLTNKQFNKAANYDIIWKQLIDKYYEIDLNFMKALSSMLLGNR